MSDIKEGSPEHVKKLRAKIKELRERIYRPMCKNRCEEVPNEHCASCVIGQQIKRIN